MTFAQDYSVEVAARWKRGPVSLLWVDGDHSLTGVQADVAAWTPHLAPDAPIVLHDSHFPGPAWFHECCGLYGYALTRMVGSLAVFKPVRQ